MNEFARGLMILAEDRHDFFWSGRLGELCEAAKPTVDHGYFAPMVLKNCFATRGNQELCQLRGQEPP